MKKIKLILILLLILFIKIDNYKAYTLSYKDEKSTINEKYAFSPKFNGVKEVKYNLNSEWTQCTDENLRQACTVYGYEYHREVPENALSETTNAYIVYKNVGKYNGKDVDLKISLKSIIYNDTDYVSFKFYDKKIGFSSYSHLISNDGERADFILQIDYLYSENNKEIGDFYSNVNFTDIDYKEILGIETGAIDYVYLYDTKNVLKDLTGEEKQVDHIDRTSKSVNGTNYKFYEGTRNFTFLCSYTGKSGGIFINGGFSDVRCGDDYSAMGEPAYGIIDYKEFYNSFTNKDLSSDERTVRERINNQGDKINILASKSEIRSSYGENISDKYLILEDYKDKFDYSGIATALLKKSSFKIIWKSYYVGLEDNGYLTIEEPGPIKTVDKGKASPGNTIKYTITQKFPNQPDSVTYDFWQITDKLPDGLTLNNVSIAGLEGDASDKFSIVQDGNKFTYSAKNLSSSKDYFYNNTFTVTVTATINNNVDINTNLINTAQHCFQINDNEGVKCLKSSVTTKVVDSCQDDLDNVKASCGTNGICTSNQIGIIEKLYELYNKYSNKDYNELLNFKLDGSNLDISKTSCSTVKCTSSSSLSCNSNSVVNSTSTNSSDTNKRVCYNSPSSSTPSSTHSTQGSFKYEDLGIYCSVSYKYKLPFNNETVKAGQILWKRLSEDSVLGNLVMNVECDGIVPKSKVNDSLIFNKFPDNIKANIKLGWTTGNDDFTQSLELADYTTEEEKESSCSGDTCYGVWRSEYTFPIKYGTVWYSQIGTGKFIKKNGLIDTTKYKYMGMGLPIAVDEKVSSSTAILTFSALNYDEISTVCPYSIENEILKKKCTDSSCTNKELTNEFNFDFRIIDTTNPFPGIDSSGRLTGSNWCSDSLIGKISYDSGSSYIVGDVNGDGIVNASDWQTTETDFISSIAADIDGNGEITYNSINCKDSNDDSCILARYTGYGDKNSNCQFSPDKNNIVKKYITDATSSNSTDTPMYSFTITPSEVKEIREYNKKHSYNDFNLTCDNNGEHCLSTFLTNWIKDRKINSTTVSVKVDGTNSSCYNKRISNSSNNIDVWCNNK